MRIFLLFVLLWSKVSAWGHSTVWVATLAGNGTQASVDGLGPRAALSEPLGLALAAGTNESSLYFTEFGGSRYQNATRCDIGGFHCSSKDKNPACMSAPGRSYNGINNCECGCDVFYQMRSGHRLRRLDAQGRISTLAGSGVRGHRDGPALQAEFNHPYGVLPLADQIRVLVADAANHAIREYSARTESVRTVAGLSGRGCSDTSGLLNYPTGLAASAVHKDRVYVADRGNNCIRALDTRTYKLRTVAGQCCSGAWGHRDGKATTALFSGPTSLVATALQGSSGSEVLYVTDGGNNAVRVVTVTDSAVSVSTLEARSSNGLRPHLPTGISLGGSDLFVSSNLGGTVLRFTGVAGDRAEALHVVAGDGNYSFANGPGTSSSFRGAQGLLWLPRGALVVADRFNNRLRVVQGLQDGHAPTNESKPWSPAVTAPRTTSSGKENLRRSAPAKAAPVRVLIWSGHSGPYHDHFVNSEVLARGLNSSGLASAVIACTKDESEPCEAKFSHSFLSGFDVLLLYADTYESPGRGTLTDDQWDALFGFVEGGGGLFALHTASACWDHQADDPTDPASKRFHRDLLNAAFGGHSPYKDYVSHVVDPDDAITHGLSDYVVSDELYHPVVYNASRSTVFLTAYDPGECGPSCARAQAVHGMRHTYGRGRVLYFAQGHDMAEFENTEEFGDPGNHAFGTIIRRSLLWLSKRLDMLK